MANTALWNKSDAGAYGAIAITPSDSVSLTVFCKALYVGTTGNVKVTMLDGTTPTFTAVPAGALLPIQVTQVFSTGTTASTIIGLY